MGGSACVRAAVLATLGWAVGTGGAAAEATVEGADTRPATPATAKPIETVVVVGDRLKRELPDVDGTRLLAGKRTSVALLADVPPIEGPNFRQAFAEIPGLLVSEVSNQSWQSVSYRGLGEPHESWNLLTLKDGIPVSPDLYSYPAAYYTPPLDVVERVEFLRGGAGLVYGPLPGGVLNYVTRRPTRTEGAGAQAKLTAGSFGLRSAFAGADAASGPWRLWAYGRQSEGDGPRRVNGDFEQRSAVARVEYAQDAWRVTFGLDWYDGEFGEPGGLTRERWRADDRAGSTPVDRMFLSRTVPFVSAELTQGEWWWSARAFTVDYDRTSRRQAGGSFGQPTPAANVAILQRQVFDGTGVDLRGRRDLAFGDARHALTFGATWWDSEAPVFVDKGATPTDGKGLAGALARTARDGTTTAAFAELKLAFERLQLVPGLRYERIEQRVVESLDLGTGSPTGGPPGGPNGALSARDSNEAVLLWGLGLTWDWTDEVRLLANASRGFKPQLFNDGVTFQAGVDAAGSFDAAYSTTYELGVQARPQEWLALEAAAFAVRLENQVGFLAGPLAASPPFGAVGAGGARRLTVGTLDSRGFDVGGSIELFGPSGGPFGGSADRLRLQLNAQLLDAEFATGPAAGSTPQYAPDLLARASLGWQSAGGLELALFATWSAAQNGADNGAAEFAIPSYFVVDATASWRFGERLAINAGVNNLLDEEYVARVRPGGGGGIDPGAPRNVYVGVRYGW
ncbi:MAG: TonB-dependent receptor family protein [Pseudomonadota bacterium]